MKMNFTERYPHIAAVLNGIIGVICGMCICDLVHTVRDHMADFKPKRPKGVISFNSGDNPIVIPEDYNSTVPTQFSIESYYDKERGGTVNIMGEKKGGMWFYDTVLVPDYDPNRMHLTAEIEDRTKKAFDRQLRNSEIIVQKRTF